MSAIADHWVNISKQVAAWRMGIEYEIKFWDSNIATKGDRWPNDFAARHDSATPVDAQLADMLQETAKDGIAKLLDVGCGPYTVVGKRLDGLRLDITAVDPLADAYVELMRRHQHQPLIAPQFAVAEDLAAFFPASSFDVVHCRNALDHSFDPIRGIGQMLRVCRPGGYVLLRHADNEAEFENYSGFHQWNITADGDTPLIWNRSVHHDLRDLFGDRSKITVLDHERTVVCQKQGYIAISLQRTDDDDGPAYDAMTASRLGALWRAVVGMLIDEAMSQDQQAGQEGVAGLKGKS